MADPQATSKSAVTPRQLVVIGVLAVILVVVLIAQFGGASDKPKDGDARGADRKVASPAARPASPAPATPSAARPGEAAPAKPPAPPWPKLNADAAAQHDPFAVPEALRRQLTEARKPNNPAPAKNVGAEALAALRSKGAAVVLRSERGAAAIVGNRVVRVGDVVEGYRVVSIDPQGILLEPVGQKNPPEKRK